MQRSDHLRDADDRRPAHLDPNSDADPKPDASTDVKDAERDSNDRDSVRFDNIGDDDLNRPKDQPDALAPDSTRTDGLDADPDRGDVLTPDPAHADATDGPAADRDTPDPAHADATDGSATDRDTPDPALTDTADGKADDPFGSRDSGTTGTTPVTDTAIGVAEVPNGQPASQADVAEAAKADADQADATATGQADATATGQADVTDTPVTDAAVTDTPATPATTSADDGPVLGDRSTEFTERWRELQTSFVDSPADAVRSADVLVGEVVTALTSALTERQQALGDQWRDAPDPNTEELRSALMRYRTVFQRLIEI